MHSDSACLVSYINNGERGKRGTAVVIKVEYSLFGLLVPITTEDTQWRKGSKSSFWGSTKARCNGKWLRQVQDQGNESHIFVANRLSEGQPKQGALANDYGRFKTKEMKATYS